MLHSLPGDLVLKAKPVFDSWRTSNSKDQNTCYHNKKPKSVPGHVLFSKMFRYVLFSVTSVFKSYKELCEGGIVKSLRPILASQVDCFQASSTYPSLSC